MTPKPPLPPHALGEPPAEDRPVWSDDDERWWNALGGARPESAGAEPDVESQLALSLREAYLSAQQADVDGVSEQAAAPLPLAQRQRLSALWQARQARPRADGSVAPAVESASAARLSSPAGWMANLRALRHRWDWRLPTFGGALGAAVAAGLMLMLGGPPQTETDRLAQGPQPIEVPVGQAAPAGTPRQAEPSTPFKAVAPQVPPAVAPLPSPPVPQPAAPPSPVSMAPVTMAPVSEPTPVESRAPRASRASNAPPDVAAPVADSPVQPAQRPSPPAAPPAAAPVATPAPPAPAAQPEPRAAVAAAPPVIAVSPPAPPVSAAPVPKPVDLKPGREAHAGAAAPATNTAAISAAPLNAGAAADEHPWQAEWGEFTPAVPAQGGPTTWRVRVSKPKVWAQALQQVWVDAGVEVSVTPASGEPGAWWLTWQFAPGASELNQQAVLNWFVPSGGPRLEPPGGRLLVAPK